MSDRAIIDKIYALLCDVSDRAIQTANERLQIEQTRQILLDEIKSFRDPHVRILLAGEGNSGKSTLNNVLLWGVFAPSGSQPTTAVMTEFAGVVDPDRDYHQFNVTGFTRGSTRGVSVPLDTESLQHIHSSREGGHNTTLARELEKHVGFDRNVPPSEDSDHSATTCTTDDANSTENDDTNDSDDHASSAGVANDVDHEDDQTFQKVVVQVPSHPFLGATLSLIDLPGLNQCISSDTLRKDSLENAHMLVYVLNASAQVTQEDMIYLRALTEHIEPERLFIVVNRLNTIMMPADEEESELVRNIHEMAERLRSAEPSTLPERDAEFKHFDNLDFDKQDALLERWRNERYREGIMKQIGTRLLELDLYCGNESSRRRFLARFGTDGCGLKRVDADPALRSILSARRRLKYKYKPLPENVDNDAMVMLRQDIAGEAREVARWRGEQLKARIHDHLSVTQRLVQSHVRQIKPDPDRARMIRAGARAVQLMLHESFNTEVDAAIEMVVSEFDDLVPQLTHEVNRRIDLVPCAITQYMGNTIKNRRKFMTNCFNHAKQAAVEIASQQTWTNMAKATVFKFWSDLLDGKLSPKAEGSTETIGECMHRMWTRLDATQQIAFGSRAKSDNLAHTGCPEEPSSSAEFLHDVTEALNRSSWLPTRMSLMACLTGPVDVLFDSLVAMVTSADVVPSWIRQRVKDRYASALDYNLKSIVDEYRNEMMRGKDSIRQHLEIEVTSLLEEAIALEKLEEEAEANSAKLAALRELSVQVDAMHTKLKMSIEDICEKDHAIARDKKKL